MEINKEHDLIFADNWGEINLLGLLIREIIKKGISNQSIEKKIKYAECKIGILAGRMSSTIQFLKGRVKISNGILEDVDVIVRGKLSSFLRLNTGKIEIKPFFKRELTIKGNPLKLLPLIKILRNTISRH